MAKLYFYYSAMNAGKSTTLLQSSYNYKERGMDTLLFAPNLDTRFGPPMIYSRIGLKEEAVLFDDDFDFFAYTQNVVTPQLKCVLLDEANFLKKHQVAQLVKITKKLGIPVLTYGIRTDFTGEPFEGSKYLLAWAEELVEIKTICHCGRKATMNMRVDSQGNPITHGEQIQVGGNEAYVSMCMLHYTDQIELAPNI